MVHYFFCSNSLISYEESNFFFFFIFLYIYSHLAYYCWKENILPLNKQQKSCLGHLIVSQLFSKIPKTRNKILEMSFVSLSNTIIQTISEVLNTK